MTNPIIQLTDISASYDEKTVLSHVNLTVYEHDFLGVIGPNGGGKTTLIKIILGLLKPISGTIRFYKNGKEIPEIAMGYLPQYNSIDKKFPISVYEVVLSGLNKQKSLFHRYTPEQHELVSRIIARMGLEGLESRAIGELSGGQLGNARSWDAPWFQILRLSFWTNPIPTLTNGLKPNSTPCWKKSTRNGPSSW